MKNKKLFAILTLVCFMFTLMPVAAFAAVDGYAAVNDDYEVVRLASGSAAVNIDVTDLEASQYYYVYAVDADGALYDGLTGLSSPQAAGFTAAPEGVLFFTATGADQTVTVNFTDAGTYTVYVSVAKEALQTVVNNQGYARTDAQILALLLQEKVTMLDSSVDVKPEKADYAINFVSGVTEVKKDGEVVGYELDLKANSAYTTKTVEVQLVNTADNNEPVVGADLTITTNSSAVDVNKTTVTTNGAGKAKFKVSASTAGNFKVYIEYGTRADATLTVDAGNLEPAKVTTLAAPTAPIALYSAVGAAEVTYSITDANGNVIEGSMGQEAPMVRPDAANGIEGNYKVTVTEKPAGSSIDADELEVNYNATNAVWYLTSGTEIFDEEGTYTFKITLNNGAYATASVEVKEFQAPVEMKMIYEQNAVELNGVAQLKKLFYVDANGVTKSLISTDAQGVKSVKEAILSATGYAIDDFSATNGNVTVKEDEKYVGSKITVLAVSEKYNLTAAVELTVANEAAAVKYARTNADVAVNNTLTANIVDVDGNKVALNAVAGNYEIQYIVLDKPENAKVAVSTVSNSLAAKGEFKVSFTASEIGTYKLQTVVRYEQSGTNTNEPVVKYYSGIEDITVGNTGIDDVVVMSVGSNEIVKNGKVATIDAAPIVENNRTFVPFRALAEAFGAEVAYDEATQAVTAELNGTTVVMTIGAATYTVNGVEKTADVAPFINGSRTMVPVRFVAQAFGITVTPTYDDNGATADILFAK